MSTSNTLTVFTAVIKLFAFADDFVKQAANNSELECEQDRVYFLIKLPVDSLDRSYSLHSAGQVERIPIGDGDRS